MPGMPDRFRVALVSDARLAHAYLMRVGRDLSALNIESKLFADPHTAAGWLADAS
jgi:hypothetical protein